MRKRNTKDAFRAMGKLQHDLSAGPIALTKGTRELVVGVVLSRESALRMGVICEHDEEPEACGVCGPAGRVGRHLWKDGDSGDKGRRRLFTDPEPPPESWTNGLWDELVLDWARLGPRYRVDLICGEPGAEVALDRLLEAGVLVVTRLGDRREHDVIEVAEAVARRKGFDDPATHPSYGGVEPLNEAAVRPAESLQTLRETSEEAPPTGRCDREPEAAAAADGKGAAEGGADMERTEVAAVIPPAVSRRAAAPGWEGR